MVRKPFLLQTVRWGWMQTENKMKREDLSVPKRHVHPHNLICYPICWVNHTAPPPSNLPSLHSILLPTFWKCVAEAILVESTLLSLLRLHKQLCVHVQPWLPVFLALLGDVCAANRITNTDCEGEKSVWNLMIVSATLFNRVCIIKCQWVLLFKYGKGFIGHPKGFVSV